MNRIKKALDVIKSDCKNPLIIKDMADVLEKEIETLRETQKIMSEVLEHLGECANIEIGDVRALIDWGDANKINTEEKVMYIKSMTSGNKLPAKKVKESPWRKLFFLPHILVEYEGTNLQGTVSRTIWMYQSDIFN